MTQFALDQTFDYSKLFSAPIEDRKRMLDASKKPGLGQTIGAAINSEWVTSWMGRQLTAASAGNRPDFNYDPFRPDEWKELTDGLDPAYWSELGTANSKRQALQIRDNMLSVQRSRETLGKAGAGGVVASFAAAFLDPAVIAGSFGAGALIGTAGRGASVGARFARGAGIGLAVDVPTEAYLTSQDPERGIYDVLLTGLASMTLGGLGDVVGGKLVDRAAARDAKSVTAAAAMGAAAGEELRPRSLGEIETSVRTHLENEGWTPEDIDDMASDPEVWDAVVEKYTNQEPPDAPTDPPSLISSWNPASASDEPSAMARVRRSFVSFLSDPRAPAPIRWLGNALFTDPLAKANGGVSVMGADQFARRLFESSRDELARSFTPALRKYQKARGLRSSFESLDGYADFSEMVIREIEIGKVAGPGPAGDAIREAATAAKKYANDWLDRLRDGGSIDADTHAQLKEFYAENGYFPRQIEAANIRKFESDHKDVGRAALRETFAQAHAVKVGSLANYHRGGNLIDALGWNVRGTLNNMDEGSRAGWVSERLSEHGAFTDEEIAEFAARAESPDEFYEELVSEYARAQKFARLYLATARNIGSVTDADKFRLFTGKQLEALRRVLDDERYNNFNVELRDEDVEEILEAVSKSLTEGEKGVPANLRFRSALDNYHVFDAGPMLGLDEPVSMSVNDFLNRNFWHVNERYARSMSGDLALRKVMAAFSERTTDVADEGAALSPIRTTQALSRRVEQVLTKEGLDPTTDRLGKAMLDRLDAGVREIMSIPQPTGKVGEALRQPLRIWRKFLNSVGNGTFGFASMPESARLIAYGGARNVINSIPILREELKLARAGKVRNETLDLGEFLSSLMSSNEFNSLMSAIDPDDPRSFGRARGLDRIERGVSKIERLSFQASGFFHLERMGRRMTAAVAVNKYVNDFARGRPWNAKKLAALGLSEEDAARVNKAITHELSMSEGPASGFVRLYRAQPKSGVEANVSDWVRESDAFKNTQAASGRWFTDDLDEAKWYIDNEYPGGELTFVDVPRSDFEKWRVSNMADRGGKDVPDNPASFSRRPNKEFFLPADIAAGRKTLRDGAVVRTKSDGFGHKVTKFRVDQFEDQVAASLLTQSMSKWASRVFQESDVGSRILIQTDPTLKLMTHFLDFVIQGWDKHTLYGAQHFKDPEVWAAFAYSSFLGSLVYIAQSYALHGQRADELKKAGVDIEDFDYRKVFLAGIQRGGQFSILPQVADLVGSAFGVGAPFDARSSGLTYSGEIPGLESNPSTSYLDTIRRAIRGVGSAAFTGDDFSRDDIRALGKLLPFQRNPVAQNMLNSVANLRPEEER